MRDAKSEVEGAGHGYGVGPAADAMVLEAPVNGYVAAWRARAEIREIRGVLDSRVRGHDETPSAGVFAEFLTQDASGRPGFAVRAPARTSGSV